MFNYIFDYYTLTTNNGSGVIDINTPNGTVKIGDKQITLDEFLNTPQEEFDEILKELGNKKQCKHEWKEYKGLTEQYYFCIICDKKEKEKPKDVHNINKPWWF